MGQIGQLAVAIVGGIIGGPVGFLIGSLIGSLLFPQHIQGPRLSNLKLQDSSYGQMIPIAYGLIRVPGIVIWQTDLKEHEHHSGGKGGPEVTTFSYTASFACALCEGPIDSVRKIWADGTLIYDITGANSVSATLPCVVHIGDELQLPDPTIEAEEGTGNAPGHRGTAYCVFADFDLTNFGNRIPNLNFEVNTAPGAASPIFKVAECHTNPSPDGWAHSTFSGGGSGGGSDAPGYFPHISHWALDGSPIRVYRYFAADVFTYDNSTLVKTGTDPNSADDLADTVIPHDYASTTGANGGPVAMGHYVFDDDTTTPLYRFTGPNDSLTTSTTSSPPVISGPAAYVGALPGGFVFTGDNFLSDAGVPAGLHVRLACLSQDGRTLIVCTSEGGGIGFFRPTKFWSIRNGLVTNHGNCATGLNLTGGRRDAFDFGTGVAGQASFGLGVVENNGIYIWQFNLNNYQQATTSTPPTYGFGSAMIFWIDPDDNVFKYYAEGGTCVGGLTGAMAYAAICSPADGYMGAVYGGNIVLFSRIRGVGQITLAEIVTDVSERSGLQDSQIDVSALTDLVPGYVINQQQATRDSILPLQSAYFFDGVESSGVMKFVKRGGASVATITDDDLAARSSGGQPPAKIGIKRLQEVDLPNFLDVKYINAANDYQTGDQFAQRQTVESQLKKTIELSISLSDSKAKQIAEVLLLSAWVERNQFTFFASRKFDYLEPTDVVTIDGYVLRITQKKDAVDGTIQFDGVAALTSLWTATQGIASSSAGFSRPTPPTSQATNMVLLDIPLVSDSDAQIGFYVAAAGALDNTWRGFALYESTDGGTTYAQIGGSGQTSVIGTITEAMPDFGGGDIFDESTFLTLTVGPGGGTLASATSDAVLAGANFALIGAPGRFEMIQYRTANLTAPSTYKLSGLLRGRRGTEHFMHTHVAGDQFIALPVMRIEDPFSKLGVTRFFKAVTAGDSLAETTAVAFTDRGQSLAPYAPDELAGGLNGSGDVLVQWVRRTRIGGQWADYTDVPISESSEAYVLQVWNSSFTVCARVVTGLTSPSFTYTHAMQLVDFTAAQQHYYVTVQQVGAYGLGIQASATLPGSGGSDTAPLHPTQPYNATPPPVPPASTCTGNVINQTLSWTVGTVQQVFTPDDFGPGDVWLLKLVVPSNPGSHSVSFTGVEYQGPPTPRHTWMALSPCGAPIGGQETIGDQSFSYLVYTGTQTDPKKFVLQPSTTYYVVVETSDVSKMLCNFLIR